MRRVTALLTILFILLLLAGCHAAGDGPLPTPEPSGSPQVTVQPTPTPEPTPTFTNPLTGLPSETDLSGIKPVAVMLNNLQQALPQQGNGQADIIYEVLAEGGITRMLAVYQDPSQVGLIGAVRSARLYYWQLAQGHDAVYIHAGGSPEFYSAKQSQGAVTVDGVNGVYSYADNGMFWRDRERIEGHYYAYEHSLLTSGEAISTILAKDGVLGAHREGYTYEMTFLADGTPAGGENASVVTVPFSSYKTGVFRYDSDSGLYLAEEYGEPYLDGNDNSQVGVTNLLILQTTCTVVDNDGRLSVDLSEGEGWYACGGQLIPITWSKGGAQDQLRYFTQDGQPLSLGAGKSYVCIIPTTREITVE